MKSLDGLLQACAALHHHLCPRQVLGVRMGMLAGEILGLDLPQSDKRLLTIVETDGCGADGISVATGCWVGRRTLRIEDYGKVAATFVDTGTGRAVRIIPRVEARQLACEYAPEAPDTWQAQLLGYQRMPAQTLLSFQPVHLNVPVEQLVSRAGQRVICERCGEEIMNEREVVREGLILCKSCAGSSYYSVTAECNALVSLQHMFAPRRP
jgi:formylmethanofuran dehydrogenase subunit E